MTKRQEKSYIPLDIMKPYLHMLLLCSMLATVAALRAQPIETIGRSPSSDTLYLQEVLTDVMRSNDRAAAARFMEQAASQNASAAGAWKDPMLMTGLTNVPLSFDLRMDPMTMIMFGVTQEIPYAGQMGLRRSVAEAEAGAAAQERRGMEIDLITAAKSAYIELYYGQKSLEELRHQKDIMSDIAAAVSARLQSGQATQAQALAAGADQWRLESMINSSLQMTEEAWYTLSQLRGISPAPSMRPLAEPIVGRIPDSPDPWLAAAETNYPPLQALKYRSGRFDLEAASMRRMRWPMLQLSAAYGWRLDAEMEPRDDMISLQAQFTLPIFEGRRQGRLARAMTAMKGNADAEARQMMREVEAYLRALHSKASYLHRNAAIYSDRIIPADEDALASALTGYRGGSGSLADVLTYAAGVYRDRITVNQLMAELAKTLIEAQRYTTDPASLALSPEMPGGTTERGE